MIMRTSSPILIDERQCKAVTMTKLQMSRQFSPGIFKHWAQPVVRRDSQSLLLSYFNPDRQSDGLRSTIQRNGHILSHIQLKVRGELLWSFPISSA